MFLIKLPASRPALLTILIMDGRTSTIILTCSFRPVAPSAQLRIPIGKAQACSRMFSCRRRKLSMQRSQKLISRIFDVSNAMNVRVVR